MDNPIRKQMKQTTAAKRARRGRSWSGNWSMIAVRKPSTPTNCKETMLFRLGDQKSLPGKEKIKTEKAYFD